jgi:hypothetical protein
MPWSRDGRLGGLHRTALLAVLSLAGTVVHGCSSQKACTLIGCASSFEVGFTGATGIPGVYRVEVVADGATSSCEITLPFTCDTQPACSSSDLPWRLTRSGCALGADRETIDGFIFFSQPPMSLTFDVRRDGRAVGGGSITPVYTESRPNGPECDPVCRTAPRLDVAISP